MVKSYHPRPGFVPHPDLGIESLLFLDSPSVGRARRALQACKNISPLYTPSFTFSLNYAVHAASSKGWLEHVASEKSCPKVGPQLSCCRSLLLLWTAAALRTVKLASPDHRRPLWSHHCCHGLDKEADHKQHISTSNQQARNKSNKDANNINQKQQTTASNHITHCKP